MIQWLFIIFTIRSTFTEEFTGIGFDDPNKIETSKFKRAIKRENGIEMRLSAEGGSLLTFKDPNPNDDWSFEFVINDIDLSFPQRAGIYLWYTDHELDLGLFHGSQGKFNGIMTGLEFIGKSPSIILSSNEGDLDFSDKEEYDIMTSRDDINPERFRDLKDIKMKVISTARNFKIEIYNGDKLIYDSFRYLKADEIGDLKKGKHFSITTVYEKVPLEKHFILKSAKLYKRNEHDNYDPYTIHAPTIETKARYHTEVNHSDFEIKHLISNIEHFMKYIRNFVGEPAGFQVLRGIGDINDEIQMFSHKIEEIVENIKKNQDEPKGNVIELANKFDALEKRMNYIQSSVDQFQYFLTVFGKRHKKHSYNIVCIVIIGIGVAIVISLIRYLTNKSRGRNKM